MVRHTLKILQQMLQDFKIVSDHFTTLRSEGLKYIARMTDGRISLMARGIMMSLKANLRKFVMLNY